MGQPIPALIPTLLFHGGADLAFCVILPRGGATSRKKRCHNLVVKIFEKLSEKRSIFGAYDRIVVSDRSRQKAIPTVYSEPMCQRLHIP